MVCVPSGSGRVPEGCRHRGKLSVHISEYGDDAGESGLYHADGDIGSGKQEGGKLCLYLILWPRLSWTRYLTGYMGNHRFLNDFFVMMNNMGVELFALPWVEAVTTFLVTSDGHCLVSDLW